MTTPNNETRPLRKGDVVRFWPGVRSGIGHLSVCERDQSVLSGHTPGVYLRRSDRDGHMDFIALTHVELVRRRVVPNA